MGCCHFLPLPPTALFTAGTVDGTFFAPSVSYQTTNFIAFIVIACSICWIMGFTTGLYLFHYCHIPSSKKLPDIYAFWMFSFFARKFRKRWIAASFHHCWKSPCQIIHTLLGLQLLSLLLHTCEENPGNWEKNYQSPSKTEDFGKKKRLVQQIETISNVK